MKFGTKLGIVFSIIGSAIGAHFYMSAVYTDLLAGNITGAEAGLHCAFAGSIVGLTALLVTYLSKQHVRKQTF